MDPLIVLVLVVFLIVVLYLVFRSGRFNKQDEESTQDTVYDFDASEDISATVRRTTQIVAPAQQSRGGKRKIVVEALPLPDTDNLQPPANKGIDALLVTVINPRVRFADDDNELNDFAPPLTMTIHYGAQETDAT